MKEKIKGIIKDHTYADKDSFGDNCIVINGSIDDLAEELCEMIEIVKDKEKKDDGLDYLRKAYREKNKPNDKEVLNKVEKFLQDEHAKQYHGLDDDMPDAFDDWICELDPDDWIELMIKLYRSSGFRQSIKEQGFTVEEEKEYNGGSVTPNKVRHE